MARRESRILRSRGETFRFYYERGRGDALHITYRHGTTPEDAIATFFEGVTEPYDPIRQRYITCTDTLCLYWARHGHDGSIVVISCFVRGDAS